MRAAHYLNYCLYQHPVTIIFFGIFPSTQSPILANKKNPRTKGGRKKRMFRKLVLKIIKRDGMGNRNLSPFKNN